MTGSSVDRITATFIQSALMPAAEEEVFAVLKKTAMSPMIYEMLDVGTGVTAASGSLI